MENKTVNLDVEVLKETEEKLVVRANKPLKKDEFNLLSQLVKKQEEESGVKIVVLPYSAELVEELSNNDSEELAEAKAEIEKLGKALSELSEVVAEKEALEKTLAELEAKHEKDSAKKDEKKKEKEADK